eukprot:2996723-Lingulodinium_polyedra.AAC.1
MDGFPCRCCAPSARLARACVAKRLGTPEEIKFAMLAETSSAKRNAQRIRLRLSRGVWGLLGDGERAVFR